MLKFYSKSFIVIFIGESKDLYIKSCHKNKMQRARWTVSDSGNVDEEPFE